MRAGQAAFAALAVPWVLLPVAARIPPRADARPAAQAPSPTASPTLEDWRPQATWRRVHGPGAEPLWSGPRTPDLLAVHGAAGADGALEAWAVGSACALARFDGAAWQRVRDLEPACAAGRAYDLRDVFVRSPGDAGAVGRYTGGSGADRDCVAEPPATPDDVEHADGCGAVARLEGGAWRIVPPAEWGISRVAPALNALDMLLDPATGRWHGWAFGNDADFDPAKAIILGFEDDGAGGGRWWRSSIVNNLADDMRAVKILSPTEAWAAGESGSESWYEVGPSGAGDWSRRGLSGRDHLYALDMTDPLYGWDGGWRGRMNHYDGNCHDDDPATACWFDNKAYPIRNLDDQTMTGIDVRGIDLVRRGVGWLVGERDSRRSTVAYLRGERWHQVAVEGDPGRDLMGLWLASEHRGWAVGAEGVVLAYGADAPPPTAIPTSTPTALAPPITPSQAAATATPSQPPGTPTATAAATPTDRPTAPTAEPSATPVATEPSPGTPTGAPATAPSAPWRAFAPFSLRPR